MINIRIADLKDIDLLDSIDGHIDRYELINSINLGRIYILEFNNIFAGWLRYNLFWDNIPFMNMLYILEDYQDNGYGSILVNKWEEDMEKLGYNKIMTSCSSEEYSQFFYRGLGYKTVGGFRLEDDPFEILMYKSLDRSK